MTAPMRSRLGTSSGRSPGSRAISRKPRTEPSSARVPSRRVASRRSARSRVVSTSNRAQAVAPRSRHSQPASLSARGAPLSLSHVLERGESPIQVAGDDERVGTEAVVGDDLAGDRGEQRCRVPRRPGAPGPLRRRSRPRPRCRSRAPDVPRRRTSVPSGTTRHPVAASNGSGATAAPSRPSRCDSSAASNRCPSAATAACEPNGWSVAGVATRTSGAGRSGIRRCRRGGIGLEQVGAAARDACSRGCRGRAATRRSADARSAGGPSRSAAARARRSGPRTLGSRPATCRGGRGAPRGSRPAGRGRRG